MRNSCELLKIVSQLKSLLAVERPCCKHCARLIKKIANSTREMFKEAVSVPRRQSCSCSVPVNPVGFANCMATVKLQKPQKLNELRFSIFCLSFSAQLRTCVYWCISHLYFSCLLKSCNNFLLRLGWPKFGKKSYLTFFKKNQACWSCEAPRSFRIKKLRGNNLVTF